MPPSASPSTPSRPRPALEAFDDCLIAIDEFHHVSAGDDNRLGEILRRLLVREKAHVVAMTGSYFRGDSIPVLRPEDEAKFRSITYSYYEQLDGYEHLKSLGISYSFYRGKYISAIPDVLDTDLKTIIHIPHRGSAEAYGEKNDEVGRIIDAIGEHVGRDPETGFDLVRRKSDGKILKIADLVNDNEERGGVKAALTREITGPDGRRDDAADRDKVDIIIALGMAQGRVRLALVRACPDDRLPLLAHRDRPDHRPRHAGRAPARRMPSSPT